MMQKKPLTELDFFELKNALKDFMKGQEKFKDYDFDGSNMSVLMDLLSYNTYINNWYANMAVSEMFLDSAQLRGTIVSHAKGLNYLPSSAKSSRAIVQVQLDVGNDYPKEITLPKFYKLSGKGVDKSYPFYTREAHTIERDENGEYCVCDVEIYEGKLVREVYTVSGDSTQRFVISNKNVDTDTIEVKVMDTVDDPSPVTFLRRVNIYGVMASDPVFYVEAYDGDRYEISFGRDLFGQVPGTGKIIEITYLISSQEAPNGISTFAGSDVGDYPATITVLSKSDGGAERESNESIRFFAPKSIQIQNRAVTASDYELLLRDNFSQIKAVSVYGGEELTPPQYGSVIVAVDVQNEDGATETTKELFREFLEKRCSMTIRPVIVDPKYIYVRVSTKVYYDRENTELNAADYRSLVREKILDFSDSTLSDFKLQFRKSKLVSLIDSLDENILSNDTSTWAVIEETPPVGQIYNTSINFGNPLLNDYIYGTSIDPTKHKPALKSSYLYHNGIRGFLVDNAEGRMDFVNVADGVYKKILRNVASVDYATGEVVLKNINLTGYDNGKISFYGLIDGSDITAPKDRVILIRDEDISVTAIGE